MKRLLLGAAAFIAFAAPAVAADLPARTYTKAPAYTAPEVWDHFDAGAITLCSPDPQAIRPPGEKVNVLQVTLPTNFKVARFDNERGNEIVRQLEQENPNFKFHVTCTRATAEDCWDGRCGRVDAQWVKSHVNDLSHTVFYACGPNALVEFAEASVFELGAPKEQMKTEKWG